MLTVSPLLHNEVTVSKLDLKNMTRVKASHRTILHRSSIVFVWSQLDGGKVEQKNIS